MNKMLCILGLILLSLALASPESRAAEVRTVEVTVARSDTLKALCRKYLQEPEQWQPIARFNHLSHPDHLSPGQKLLFPVELLRGVPLEARVIYLKGTGWVRGSAAEEWRELREGETLKVGSSLKSGPASSVEVSFEDGTRFLLRENTVITVKDARQGILHLLRVLYLEAGKVITRVKKATGRDSRFEIETPSALAAARGTEYRVAVDPKATTRAEMLESSISFSAQGSTVVLNQDEGSLARLREPPLPPRRLLPPPEPADLLPAYRQAPLAFRFAPVPGAARFRAVLARDPEGKDIVAEQSIAPDETFRVNPEADGIYYLLASSLDPDGLEGRGAAPRQLSFRRERVTAPPPLLLLPEPSAQLRGNRTGIRWHGPGWASPYQLQLASDPGFGELLVDRHGLQGTSFTTGILKSGSYWLRLRGSNPDGTPGPWCEATGFTMLQLPPPTLRQSSKDGKGWNFCWEAPEPGLTCQVQLASDPEFRGIILERIQPEPELHLTETLQPGTYYLRVRAVDASGAAGSYSQPATFQVEKPGRFPYEFLGVGAVLLLLLL